VSVLSAGPTRWNPSEPVGTCWDPLQPVGTRWNLLGHVRTRSDLLKHVSRLAKNKQAEINFLKVVNYILRHKTITLILVIHNLFSNNLSNDILCAHHVFLSYSNLWYLIMRWYYILYFYKALHTFFFIFFRKLFLRLGGPEAIDFFQSFQKANYHFADVN
jgi:hypothetical protein